MLCQHHHNDTKDNPCTQCLKDENARLKRDLSDVRQKLSQAEGELTELRKFKLELILGCIE